MPANLANSELISQVRSPLSANGQVTEGSGPWRMAGPGRKTYRPKGQVRRMYLGEWLNRLEVKQGQLAKGVGVSATYISELVNPKSGEAAKNPTPGLLLAISEFLGITVNDLYAPPPSRSDMERAPQPNKRCSHVYWLRAASSSIAAFLAGSVTAGCVHHSPTPDMATTPVVLASQQIAVVETTIRKDLKDPDSAQFSGYQAAVDANGIIAVCGYVNAKNSYGGYIGRQPFVGYFPGTSTTFNLGEVASPNEYNFSANRVRAQCQRSGIAIN